MIPGLLLAAHLLAAVTWVGGMAFAAFVLRPSLSTLEPPQRLILQRQVLRRFLGLVWHAMPLALLTGWGLLFGWYGGFAGAGWHVHLMHLTALVMAAVFLSVVFGPWPALRVALDRGDRSAAAAAAERIRNRMQMSLALGVLTIAVAAFGRFV
jgi:uncharacterized membrane protein